MSRLPLSRGPCPRHPPSLCPAGRCARQAWHRGGLLWTRCNTAYPVVAAAVATQLPCCLPTLLHPGFCAHPHEAPQNLGRGLGGRGGGGARWQQGARNRRPCERQAGAKQAERRRMGERGGCPPHPFPGHALQFKPGDRVMAATDQHLRSGEQYGATPTWLRPAAGSAEHQWPRNPAQPTPLPCSPPIPTGTSAEYVAVDEALCCAIPEGVGFQEAGVLPVSGITALQALRAGGALRGKRVLVHAGAGGVGGFAVQVGWPAGHDGRPCQPPSRCEWGTASTQRPAATMCPCPPALPWRRLQRRMGRTSPRRAAAGT